MQTYYQKLLQRSSAEINRRILSSRNQQQKVSEFSNYVGETGLTVQKVRRMGRHKTRKSQFNTSRNESERSMDKSPNQNLSALESEYGSDNEWDIGSARDQIKEYMLRIEDSPHKYLILKSLMKKYYSDLTADKQVQTIQSIPIIHEQEHKISPQKSKSLVVPSGPRYSKVLRIPRIHPATRFMLKLALEISQNPQLVAGLNLSLNKTVKKVCQIFVERSLNKDSHSRLLQFLYDTIINTYGLASMAEKKLTELILQILTQTKKHAIVQIFARFAQISSVHYSLDELYFFFRLIQILDTKFPAARVPSISQRAQQMAKFLPRELPHNISYQVIEEMIGQVRWTEEKQFLMNKVKEMTRGDTDRDIQEQSLQKIQLYVFVGIFLSVYKQKKNSILRKLQDIEVVVKKDNIDLERMFYKKEKYLLLMESAIIYNLCSKKDSAALHAYFDKQSVLPSQILLERLDPQGNEAITDRERAEDPEISVDLILGFIAKPE